MMGQKWGAGHFAAWLRGGSKEFAQVLQAFPDSIRLVEEPGLVGNPTPQEVLHDKGKDGLYQDWLQSKANEAGRERGDQDMGREL
jgi:hypothetical protein